MCLNYGLLFRNFRKLIQNQQHDKMQSLWNGVFIQIHIFHTRVRMMAIHILIEVREVISHGHRIKYCVRGLSLESKLKILSLCFHPRNILYH